MQQPECICKPALYQAEPTGEAALAQPPPTPWPPPAIPQAPGIGGLRVWAQVSGRVAHAAVALVLFVLALEVLKSGASGLIPLLDAISAEGTINMLGLGWIGSYLLMSGSPVAAIGLSLFAGHTISDIETLALINGTRLGASFVVLFVGFLYYVGGRRTADGLYIGVVALLTTFTLWLPALPLSTLALRQGWLDGLSLRSEERRVGKEGRSRWAPDP